MKREKILHLAVTEDEYKELILLMNNKEVEDGKRYTTSTYLREFVLGPHLNGQCSPSEDTEQETEPEKPEKGLWEDIEF